METIRIRVASFALVSLFAIPALGQNGVARDGTKPNIVFILMDNLGYGELGCYGRIRRFSGLSCGDGRACRKILVATNDSGR
jgi:hypothetical protein